MSFVVLAAAVVSGCAAPSSKQSDTSPPPQLWSDHKRLTVAVDACAAKARAALSSLGFSGIAQNGGYSYGNLNGNRAAVKCVEIAGGSFVYFAVAGAEREAVERLRNEIAWKL